MSSSEPGPRREFFSFKRYSSVYVWGGKKDARDMPVDDLGYLYKFDYPAGMWARLKLKGKHPPGIHSGSCARIDDIVYFYGGLDKSGRRTGSLHQLNLTTLTWQGLCPPGPSSPSKKQRCGMIEHENRLILHGGDTERGRTNETHTFDIATGIWSSPQVSGDVPKPDGNFEFCKVSENQVVKCGGMYDSNIYALDLSTMHWIKVHESGPVLGLSATATCIGYGSDQAQLLMIGLNGVWLWDVATWELKRLQDTDLIGVYGLRRHGHCTTMLSSTPTSITILILGGDGITIMPALLILRKNKNDIWWRMAETINGKDFKERTFYHSDPTCGDKDSATEVLHIDGVSAATEKNARFESSSTSSNQLRLRSGNNEPDYQKERSTFLKGYGSTAKGKGTSRFYILAFIAIVAALIVIFIIQYFRVYIPSHLPKENVLSLNLASLSRELRDIDEWLDICTYFGVKKFLINRIEDEYTTSRSRKEKCLSAYLDSGDASWEHVVDVISKFPFYKCALGKKIARRYHIPFSECINDND